jgi:hypothetical protein
MTDSPTFVAKFADGETTRMSVHCPSKLDIDRGVRLARHAYRSRKGREPPPMVAGHFERDGHTLESYGTKRLARCGGRGERSKFYGGCGSRLRRRRPTSPRREPKKNRARVGARTRQGRSMRRT